jgi:acetylornithine/succinyldiaminopimelate/putrescine aminotransferase
MKAQGVVMGISGPFGNILKIRPPLIFSEENADELLLKLEAVLQSSRQSLYQNLPHSVAMPKTWSLES